MLSNELLLAICTNDLDQVKTLVTQGANIRTENDYAVRLASYYGHLQVVKYLVEQGANLRAKDDYALRVASKNGYFPIVKYLVEQGADLHAENDYAIGFASYNGHFQIVKYLVEQGANIHAENDFALRVASQNGHLQIVNYLSVGCERTYSKMPDDFVVHENKECLITHETFTDEMKKLVCNKCRNLFLKEALEDWFVVEGMKCPLRCGGAEFYEM